MYQVNWAEVHAAAASVNSASGQLDAILSDVNTDGNRLAASWAGETQRVYHERQATWNQSCANIKQALDMFVKSLTAAAETASSTEDQNVRRMSG